MAGSESKRSAWRTMQGWLAAGALALAMPLAQAAPMSGGTVSGLPGDFVSPSVVDSSLIDFEGADFTITFDPAVLTLVDVTPGGFFTVSSLILGLPAPGGGGLETVAASFAISNGPFSGISITMFSALFQIVAGAAPGFTTVHFETLDATLYDLDVDVQVQVLAANGVPEAGMGWLMAAAGGALLLSQRRRRTGA